MELLRIYVNIVETMSLTSAAGSVQMILFDGYCRSNIFQGNILPGGVDTQVLKPDGSGSLSARYMLHGTDADGNSCKLFIENNAETGKEQPPVTQPRIYTDNPRLKWLETADLYGKMLTENGQLVISVCQKD